MIDYIKMINDISAQLGISAPDYEIVEQLKRPTMKAALDTKKRCIYIRKDLNGYDLIFAVVHELRHLWQYDTCPEKLEGYDLSEEGYNLQWPEVDANAYAFLFMEEELGVRPVVKMDKEALDSIYERMGELRKGV